MYNHNNDHTLFTRAVEKDYWSWRWDEPCFEAFSRSLHLPPNLSTPILIVAQSYGFLTVSTPFLWVRHTVLLSRHWFLASLINWMMWSQNDLSGAKASTPVHLQHHLRDLASLLRTGRPRNSCSSPRPCSLASGICSRCSACWPHSGPPSRSSGIISAHPSGSSPLSWEDFLECNKYPYWDCISSLPALPLLDCICCLMILAPQTTNHI